jgi:hypothetical protein
MAFKKHVLCRYPIDWDTEHHRHLLSNTRDFSPAARDSHDRFPDIRRQAVPASGKLAQGEISAGNVQTGERTIDATVLLRGDLRFSGRGCNSRRLHFF